MPARKPNIRSIAFFLERRSSVNDYIEYCYRAVETLNRLKKELENAGYSVFTTRIVYPELDDNSKRELIERIDLGRDVLISIGPFNVAKMDRDLVAEAVDRGFYATLRYVWVNPLEYSRAASELIHRVSDANPINASRLSISFHEEALETPYYPDTVSSGVEGVGISFLLPKHVIEFLDGGGRIDSYPSAFERHVVEILDVVRKSSGVSRVFFDYSISPWMENSVVDLVERVGYKFLEPGFNYGLHLLNELIERIVEKIGRHQGFNEVMLPYAEDYRLVDAGSRGLLRARDLLLYSLSCVVGPDMIVVPSSVERLSKYMLDVYSAWLVKGRPIGMRAIPVSSDVGDGIDLGKFGRVYVIDY